MLVTVGISVWVHQRQQQQGFMTAREPLLFAAGGNSEAQI